MQHRTAKFSLLTGLFGFCEYTFYLYLCSYGPPIRNSLPFPSSYPDCLPSFGALLRPTSSWKSP